MISIRLRLPSRIGFADFAENKSDVATHVIYSEPLEDDLDKRRCDSVGGVTRAFLKSKTPYNFASFHFCGPKPFMQCIHAALKELGVGDDRIHFEFFGPKQDVTSAAA